MILTRDITDEMFKLITTAIPGCVELQPRVHEDPRGRFVKTYHNRAFASLGLETELAEEYYSVSHRGVIRGLHFQVPPMDHAKIVYCVSGRVQDAVLDLRAGSPVYGHYALLELSASSGNILYVPRGVAHGFCVLSDTATLVYNVSSVYSPEHDGGIRWNSAGIPWAEANPSLSERDRAFPLFESFVSPFLFEKAT